MAFFSIAARIALMVFVLGIGACSSTEDSLFYGYEENFVVPKPDMVPVTPDDKPGRTVDEMLSLTSPSVTVKKKEDKPVENNQVYEHAGRFGSKEKISLRKGLNAPDSGVLYGSQKRKDAQEIRALEVKKREKDELQAMSEEEMLTSIIAPKATKLELIEVVPAQSDKKTEEPHRLLPSSEKPTEPKEAEVGSVASFETARETETDKEKIVLSSPITQNKTGKYALSASVEKTDGQKTDAKQEEFVLLKPLVVSENEEAETKKQKENALVSLKPLLAREKVVLTPPSEEIVLLKKPGTSEDDSSVEIFLDE